MAVEGDRRHALGQWSTPPALADLAIALAGPIAGRSVMDPACGDGALLARVAPHGAGRLLGVEIDPAAAAAARAQIAAAAIVTGDVLDDAVARPIGEVDLVIGNPPYVRHGRRDPADKRRRAAAIAADWPDIPRDDAIAIAKRGDLAASCMLRALRLVRPGGRLVLVVSSALLDADVAERLWRAVAGAGRVAAIVAAPAERWFGAAAVNAMIVVIERGAPPGSAQVARLTIDTAAAAARLQGGAPLSSVADVRAVADHEPRAWATALRAPRAWLDAAAAAGDALVPLGALATIRRGATTGGNRFFYLKRADAAARAIEPSVLAPVVRSPYNGAPAAIAIDPDATPIVALTAPASADLAALPGLRAWIDANADLADRPSLARVPHPWWHLPAHPARLFVSKAYGPRFVQRLAPAPMLADQRVYAIEPRAGVDLLALAGVLNATPTALALESLGRASMGHGAVEHTARDLAALPVLDVRRADAATRATLAAALTALAPRLVEHVALERDRPDRAALDTATLALAPALAPLLPAMWDALLASVKLRDRWLLPSLAD
jgi:predicted RNA methylase